MIFNMIMYKDGWSHVGGLYILNMILIPDGLIQ